MVLLPYKPMSKHFVSYWVTVKHVYKFSSAIFLRALLPSHNEPLVKVCSLPFTTVVAAAAVAAFFEALSLMFAYSPRLLSSAQFSSSTTQPLFFQISYLCSWERGCRCPSLCVAGSVLAMLSKFKTVLFSYGVFCSLLVFIYCKLLIRFASRFSFHFCW